MKKQRNRKSVIELFIFLIFISNFSLCGQTLEPLQSTRTKAMGGLRPQFKGEASTGFLNPAAMAGKGGIFIYIDGVDDPVREIKVAVEAGPWKRLNLLILGGRREGDIGLYGFGLSGRILSGTPDTYLNIGVNAGLATGLISCGEHTCCGDYEVSEGEGFSLSAGIIFRPLPSFSFSYIGEGVINTGCDESNYPFGESQRAGVTLYIRERIMLSMEREYRGGSFIDHYGFNVLTGIPLEIMTGYCDGSVSGGIRASCGFLSSSIVFSETGHGNISGMLSLEYAHTGYFEDRN